MDLLKRRDGGGLQRLFFGIAKTHAELKRKARRRGPGRDMANMRLMGYLHQRGARPRGWARLEGHPRGFPTPYARRPRVTPTPPPPPPPLTATP
jgi:hypothetical protein